MPLRAPILTEDTNGIHTPLEPGSVVPGPTPGYYQIGSSGIATSVSAVPNTIPIRDASAGFENAYLTIDSTPAVIQTGGVGKMVWNDIAGTIEYQLKGGVVNLQIGQENVLRVRNEEVTPLVDGEVVYIYGSSGTHNTVKRASALTEGTSANTIGIVTEPIGAHPGEGFITTFGMVTCNTNHLIEGGAVWLSTVSGQTTSTKPVAPNHLVLIGWCVKKAGPADGRLFVSVNNGYELSELHDVLIGAQAEGDILVWDNTTKVWRNKVPSTGPWVLKAGDTMAGTLTQQVSIDFTPVTAPTLAPTVAALAVPGNVNVGLHYYFYSYVTSVGETTLSPYAGITIVGGSQQVQVTNIGISPDSRVIARKIYRTGAGQPYYSDARLVTTINDNATTSFTDNLLDASRTGPSNNYYRDNTTCKYFTKNGATAGFLGTNSTIFGAGAYPGIVSGTATGGFNTCVGVSAGSGLTTGDQNIIITNGSTAISTGTSNVLIHGNWGNNPSNSVGIGRNCMGQNSGTDNVCIGYGAGSVTGHNYGVALGSYANYWITGNGCIGIGYNAGRTGSASAGSYNINIGSGVISPVAANSGQLNIANVIYGVNGYQNTATSSTPTSTGSIGIGLTTPTARLHLPPGSASVNTAPLKLTSGVNTTAVEDGAIEYNGTKFFTTISSERQEVVRGITSATTLTPTSVAANSESIQTYTVTGLLTTHTVSVSPPSSISGLGIMWARCSATNTLEIGWRNFTGLPITPPTGSYKVLGART